MSEGCNRVKSITSSAFMLFTAKEKTRKCWVHFQAVAGFEEGIVEALLQPEAGIIRHRQKILSTINNAKYALPKVEM